MPDLTDDQILSALGRMDQEQKFFEQMNAGRAAVREIITRYKEIADRMPALAAEEKRLKDSIAGIESTIRETRRAELLKTKAEHDQLMVELREQIAPLKAEALRRRDLATAAKSLADQVERECAARVTSALSAAEAADMKRNEAEAAFAVVAKRFTTV
jgi:uncharacterized protein YdcH (DUF465 family)